MSEPNEDFVSFEKALRELELQDDELKKLVSEGEIRAFREGGSIKFKREDIERLRSSRHQDEITFDETLEDDTGMVTEELSDEDTLLAEDDLIEEPEPAPVGRTAGAGKPARSRARAPREEPDHEPVWVTGAAVLSTLALLYGFMICYSIAQEQAPAGLLGLFASH